jgi:hypothetical protein
MSPDVDSLMQTLPVEWRTALGTAIEEDLRSSCVGSGLVPWT